VSRGRKRRKMNVWKGRERTTESEKKRMWKKKWGK